MLRKYLARLLAFVLVLNLVLCAPLSAGAEEGAEGDQPNDTPIITDENKDDLSISQDSGTLVVTDEASVSSSVDITTDDEAGKQTVTVDTPLVGSEIDDTRKENVHEESYEGNNGETIPYTQEDSFDLKAEITNIEETGDEVTDIEYNISLEGQTAITEHSSAGEGSEETDYYSKPNIDQWLNGDEPEDERSEFKVNMSINGMNDEEVTRVEHTYKETESGDVKVEYYYNAKTKTDTEADSGKKFFTVVQETVENVRTSFVSLVTNFLGKFHITTDAFENKDTNTMSTALDDAVNSAASGSTVEMLRDYTTGNSAEILNSDNVTVDLNRNAYNYTGSGNAVHINGDRKNLTIQNGTITSGNRGIRVDGNGNQLTVCDSTIAAKGDVGIFDKGNNNTTIVKNSTVIAETNEPIAIYHNGSFGGAKISVIGSYVYAGGAESVGIYVSGNINSDNNSLELKNSTVKSETGVEVKFTNVTINDSELIGFGEPGDYTANGNGSTTVGTALAVTDNSGDGITRGKIVINSGNFKGSKDIDNIYLAVKEGVDKQATITLNGGRFVYPNGLYKYTDSTHAVISYNDGSEYPYEVVKDGTTPTRPGYTLQGYKDDKGNDITLAEAIATKTIAYAQWKLIPAADTTEEAPAKTPTTEAPKDAPAIIVEADSKGNNVDVSIKDSTAVVTVSTPAGEAAAVSEVTIPSVAELQKQGVDTVEIQVEEHVTLELGIADTGDTLTDSIKVTREEDTLVISSGEKSEIVIHMTELKAAATEPVRIQYNKGVLTISLSANAVYTVDLKDALAADKALTVKLEDGVLKLYDKDGNLIQEIKL